MLSFSRREFLSLGAAASSGLGQPMLTPTIFSAILAEASKRSSVRVFSKQPRDICVNSRKPLSPCLPRAAQAVRTTISPKRIISGLPPKTPMVPTLTGW